MNNKNRPYLFVYGTLLDLANPYGAYLHQNARLHREGKLKGKLYNIGNYPGAVRSGEDDNYIYGSIFEIDDAGVVLTKLDEYEGLSDAFEQPNEFVREIADVETESGPLACWVYFYNHPVDQLPLIISGKYQ